MRFGLIINKYFFTDTMLDVAKDETVQQKVVEAARLFYNSPTVTMNLAPAILAISFLMLSEY